MVTRSTHYASGKRTLGRGILLSVRGPKSPHRTSNRSVNHAIFCAGLIVHVLSMLLCALNAGGSINHSLIT